MTRPLRNVVLATHRWPDCTTNRTAIQDIFRLEGAKSDQEKAIALWKWFRLLVSATGKYRYEGETPGREHSGSRPSQDLHRLRRSPVRRDELVDGTALAGRRISCL